MFAVRSALARVARLFVGLFGADLLLKSEISSLRRRPPVRVSEFDVAFIRAQRHLSDRWLSEHLPLSRAQLRQDLFALAAVGPDKPNFFVEFGATNGVSLSNSFLLETKFFWRGILVEPAKGWHTALSAARKCAIDQRCVWSHSGEIIKFRETATRELSTVERFADSDSHATDRREGMSYEVETVSLLDLLVEHEAPAHIGYLSMDTEGSEYEILKSFDFSKYSFGAISIEHNFTANREKIRSLLERNGYQRVYEAISQFDDWFLPSWHAEKLRSEEI